MSRSSRGFSLIETMISVVVVGALAFLATVMFTNVTSSTREQKLSSDVETLNRSVVAFLASGGDLSKARDADDVLAALKQEMENASRVPGFGGAKLDDRVAFKYQTENEAAKNSLRAYWDADQQRFILASSGQAGGIKGLDLAESSTLAGNSDMKAGKASMLYAKDGNWIWEYADGAAPAPPRPTSITLGSTTDTTPAAPPTTPPPATGSQSPLTPPSFSVTSGSYPITSFDLPLILTNPNPAGTSEIYYSVDFGNWNLYSGPLTVPPGAVVAAQTIAVHQDYQNSGRIDQTYTALLVGLVPPLIVPSSSEFGLLSNRLLTVTLTDLNSPGVSKMQYRTAKGSWQDYTGPFSLTRTEFPSGAMVEARAIPIDPNYLASTAALRSLGVETPSVAGASVGSFSAPTGSTTMLTNLSSAGAASSYFEWGRDYLIEGESMNKEEEARLKASHMSFTGTSFTAAINGDPFQIGNLSYYNGTIVSGTAADAIRFSTNVSLNLNGYTASANFNFDFNLINTVNKLDPNDPWADADYVQLRRSIASETLNFNGVLFQLQLEFGETTSSGFASFNEFYILEGANATTKVYGTLVEVGTVNFNF